MSVESGSGRRGGKRPGAGRPPGQPNRLSRDIKQCAAQHGEDTLDTLLWLRDHAMSEQVRLGASIAILDRAHGRPRQELDVNANDKTIVIVDRGRPLRDLQGTEALAIVHQFPDDAG